MSLQLRGQIKQTYNMGRFESGNESSPSIAFDVSRDTGVFYANGVCVSHEGNRVMQIGDQVTVDTVLVGNGSGLSQIQASNVVGLTQALDTIDASSVTANSIVGNGAGLSDIQASNVVGLTEALDTIDASSVTANSIVGNGAGLWDIQASNVVGLTEALDTIDATSVTSNVIYGNAGDLVIGANLVPESNVTYTLGNNTHRFKDLFLSGNTISLGNVELKEQDGRLLCPTGFIGDGSLLTGVALPLTISNVQITSNTYDVLDDTAVALEGGFCIVNGEGFAPSTLVQVGGTNALATSYVSATQLRVQVPPKTAGSYNVSVIRADSQTAVLSSGLTYSNVVTWVTGTNLGEVYDGVEFSIPIVATSDSNVTYSNVSALPPNTTLSSTGLLVGNISSASSTLYSLDLKAEDEELQDALRTFLLQLIVILINGTTYTNSSWTPLTQTALDANVSNVYWTIDGTNLSDVTSVTVGGTAATSFTVVSDSVLHIQGPQKSRGFFDLTLMTPTMTKTFANAVFYSDVPVFTTAANLGNVTEGVAFNLSVQATSDSTVSYSNVTALSPQTTINASTGALTGNITGIADDTLYTFTLKATDQENQLVTQAFQLQYLLLFKVLSATCGNTTFVLTRLGIASFGPNYHGQMGTSTNSGTNNANPVPINITNQFSGKTIVAVACGEAHTVALASDGAIFSFGLNANGELGTSTNSGTSNANPTPINITNQFAGKTIVAIECGPNHTIVLASDAVYSFGRNYFGELGNGTVSYTANPTPSNITNQFAGKTIVAAACGFFHSTVLASDGSLFTFGANSLGQLGTSTISDYPTPINITNQFAGKTIVAAACGSNHTVVLASDSTIYSFGSNNYGELGTSTNSGTGNANPTPINITNQFAGKTIVAVACGYFHTIVLTSDSVYSFGRNRYGELGTSTNNGTDNANPTPINISSLFGGKTIVQVACGAYHSTVLASDGSLFTFGNNRSGQLASSTNNGTDGANPTPTNISATVRGVFLGYTFRGQISSPQVIGGEVFSASSTYSGTYAASNAFNGDYETFWHSAPYKYTTAGVYNGGISTTVSGVARAGDWLQIQFAQPVLVKRFTISPRSVLPKRMPTQFVLAGSNDGSTWTQLVYFNNSSQTYAASTDTNFDVSASETYTYFRLIFMQLVADAQTDSVQISQWKIFDI